MSQKICQKKFIKKVDKFIKTMEERSTDKENIDILTLEFQKEQNRSYIRKDNGLEFSRADENSNTQIHEVQQILNTINKKEIHRQTQQDEIVEC